MDAENVVELGGCNFDDFFRAEDFFREEHVLGDAELIHGEGVSLGELEFEGLGVKAAHSWSVRFKPQTSRKTEGYAERAEFFETRRFWWFSFSQMIRASTESFIGRGLIFGLMAALALPFARAQEKVEPFLWEISGNGLAVPSYLFGTIHLGDDRVTKLHPAVERAFGKAEVVMTEVLLDMASQLAVAPKMMRSDGKTLDAAIGKELADRVNEELARVNPALDSTPFQTFSTWVMATMIPLLPDQLAGKAALDKTLWDRAEKEGKELGAIETMEGQLSVFTDMDEEEQVIFLSESLKSMKEDRDAGKDTMKELKDAYVSGDLEKLQEIMDRGFDQMEKGENVEMAKAFKKRLFTDRDVSMAKTIDGILKAKPNVTHFFAAGAGHFSSDTSIRKHLETAGYDVARVLE